MTPGSAGLQGDPAAGCRQLEDERRLRRSLAEAQAVRDALITIALPASTS